MPPRPSSRQRLLAAVLLLAAFATTVALGQTARALPDRLTAQVFWQLSEQLSEPGGTFHSENYISNENAYQYVVPDLMTVAKGLTSSYLPLGAVAIKPEIAAHFEENVFYGGLTYNSHPLSCAAAIAAIDVLKEDDLVGNAKRLDPVMRHHHEELMAKHSSVGRVRNIGLFGILELVKSRDTMEPLSPYNVVNETMQAVNKALLERGLFTMIRFNGIMTNPPLCITEEQLDEGFSIVDEALDLADSPIS